MEAARYDDVPFRYSFPSEQLHEDKTNSEPNLYLCVTTQTSSSCIAIDTCVVLLIRLCHLRGLRIAPIPGRSDRSYFRVKRIGYTTHTATG